MKVKEVMSQLKRKRIQLNLSGLEVDRRGGLGHGHTSRKEWRVINKGEGITY